MASLVAGGANRSAVRSSAAGLQTSDLTDPLDTAPLGVILQVACIYTLWLAPVRQLYNVSYQEY
jgi:hypothetical protein